MRLDSNANAEIPILKAYLLFSFVTIWAILDVTIAAPTLNAAITTFFLAILASHIDYVAAING